MLGRKIAISITADTKHHAPEGKKVLRQSNTALRKWIQHHHPKVLVKYFFYS